ncbi:MAG: DUF4276 family protein [Anaerolineales bacterium]|nr:DUF4276 family protein [Anaerolineales bacterium]MDW8278456.1 hypothetical protein [Anaerolineales bacterium]
MSRIPINLIAEGLLDELVLRQLIRQVSPHLEARVCYGRRGRAWIEKNVGIYNNAARSWPYVALVDLETNACPPELLQKWFPNGQNPNLQIRIAVRTVEAWLLADRDEFAKFLSIPVHHIPQQPELEQHPKQTVVNLARRSTSRIILEDIVPAPHSPGLVGKNYRGQIERFVIEDWQAERAKVNAPSLQRAIQALKNFRPVVPG